MKKNWINTACLLLSDAKKLNWNVKNEFLTSISKHNNYSELSAILELFDNSVAENAKNVSINIGESEDGKVHFSIVDDGSGMSEEDICNNYLSLGESKNRVNSKVAGNFGMGGKTGVTYLAKPGTLIKMITHKMGHKPYLLVWSSEITPELSVIEDESISYGTTIFVEDSILPLKMAGTLLCDMGVWLYPVLKDGDVTLRVNSNKVKPQDQMYRNCLGEDNYYYGHTTIKGVSVPYIFVNLRGKIKPNQLNEYDRRRSVGKSDGVTSTATSGIYIVFGGRYIACGDNASFLLGRTAHTDFNGCRVELILDKSLAEIFQVSWNKTGISKSFARIPEASELHNNLLKLFRENATTNPSVKTKTGRIPKYITNASEKITAVESHTIKFELRGDSTTVDSPVLTFNVSLPTGKRKKRVATFNVNPISRKFPKIDSKVKELYDGIGTHCSLLAKVYSTYEDETFIKDAIEEFLTK